MRTRRDSFSPGTPKRIQWTHEGLRIDGLIYLPPLGQAQEMYRALRQNGVSVDLVTYPRDNHGPLAFALFGAPTAEPWHGFDARRRVVSFIEKAFGL
jgi:acetyl esterase/lipase